MKCGFCKWFGYALIFAVLYALIVDIDKKPFPQPKALIVDSPETFREMNTP